MTKQKSNKQKKSKEKLSLDLPVKGLNGKKIDTLTLNSTVFDGIVNMPLLHQVVLMYSANKRSGTASSKTKAEVRGGGKKPWKQKGTGRARSGSIRNPLWRGGGVIFGPKPRDFSYTLPQKLKRTAIKSCFNSKLLDNNLLVVENIKIETPKTKEFRAILTSLGIDRNCGVLVILEKVDQNIKLATRNIPKLIIRDTRNLNAMDMLKHKKLIIERKSLTTLMKELS